jgi:hypothetical protein
MTDERTFTILTRGLRLHLEVWRRSDYLYWAVYDRISGERKRAGGGVLFLSDSKVGKDVTGHVSGVFILPEYRRKGIYPRVLSKLKKVVNIHSDKWDRLNPLAAKAWGRVPGSFRYNPHRMAGDEWKASFREQWRTLLSNRLDESYLAEGKLEQETTALSRHIIKVFKDVYKHWEPTDPRLLYKTDGREQIAQFEISSLALDNMGLGHLDVEVTLRYDPGYLGTLYGSGTHRQMTSLGRIERAVLLKITLGKGFRQRHMTQLVNKLKGLIRHELEHTTQPVRPFSDLLKGTHAERLKQSWDKATLMDYFTYPREVAAFVSEIYKLSKMQKRPFTDVMDDHLSPYADSIGANYNTDPTFRKIRKVWMGYARKRFPRIRVS